MKLAVPPSFIPLLLTPFISLVPPPFSTPSLSPTSTEHSYCHACSSTLGIVASVIRYAKLGSGKKNNPPVALCLDAFNPLSNFEVTVSWCLHQFCTSSVCFTVFLSPKPQPILGVFAFNFLLLSCKTNNFLYKICSLWHCFFSHKNRMEMCVEGSTKRDLWKNRIIESCWRKSVTDSARLICILMTVLMFVASPQCWTAVRGTSSSWWIPRGVCHPTSTPEC